MTPHIYDTGDYCLDYLRRSCVVKGNYWHGIFGCGIQVLQLQVLGSDEEFTAYAHECEPVFLPAVRPGREIRLVVDNTKGERHV